MKITNVKINNYKSIGDEMNNLKIENDVTVLVGKNESGKSNVLESIGKLKLRRPLDTSYLSCSNREQKGAVSIVITMSYTPDELLKHQFNDEVTIFTFNNVKTVSFTGGLSNSINSNIKLNEYINFLKKSMDEDVCGFDTGKLAHITKCLSSLDNIDSIIFDDYLNALKHIYEWVKASKYDEKSDILDILVFIKDEISKYYNIIPRIYYRNVDAQLKDVYALNTIKEILPTEDIFSMMLMAAKISDDEILQAFEQSNEGARQTIRKKIKKNIKTYIEIPFNDFYNQEKIEMDVEFDSKIFKIFINTDDKAMNLSERSNGLKWYFSLFIDAVSRNMNNEPVVYLLDEPGVFLHVNAQRELLTLFSELAKKNSQIIYTTHSPSMINADNLLSVRAIEKNEKGNTKIFNCIWNQELNKTSKMETLSPLIQVIGADLKYNIGPQPNKLNIVTEGITDYIYIKTMFEYFGVNDETAPYILPSSGVDNINRVASILLGWGYEFKLILDHDVQGYNECQKLIKNLWLSIDSEIFFINGKKPNQKSDVQDENAETIESLISQEDTIKFVNQFDGTSDTKALLAKEFHDKVISNEILLSEETINNFKKLFINIGINL